MAADRPWSDDRGSRREFLKTLGLLSGAAANVRAGDLFAQGRGYRLDVRNGAIDVHHHFTPPGLGARGGGGAPPARGTTAPAGGRGGGGWTVARSLESMDEAGIATALLSMTQQGNVLYDATEKGRTAVRVCNDFGATLVQDYPRRFGLFASIPFPDVEGSLKEIEYAYDTLKCDGIGVYTNDNQGRWPGDPHLEPIWQELNRRKAVVYMHPWVPACCNALDYGATPLMVEVDFETTRAVTSLIAKGVLSRCPDVKVITAHAGGTLPVLAGRMQDRWPADSAKYIPNGLAAELKKIYYDVAHATFQMPMAALLKLVPPTQLVFGTDYFPEAVDTTVNEIPALGLSRDVLDMIERGNAERLFPRFRA